MTSTNLPQHSVDIRPARWTRLLPLPPHEETRGVKDMVARQALRLGSRRWRNVLHVVDDGAREGLRTTCGRRWGVGIKTADVGKRE